MYTIIPNNLPELPEDMTVEGFKKFLEQLIDDDELDLKDALDLVKHMISESETDVEFDICDYAVELVRQKFINQIKIA